MTFSPSKSMPVLWATTTSGRPTSSAHIRVALVSKQGLLETRRLQTSLRITEPPCRARDTYPTITQPSDAERPIASGELTAIEGVGKVIIVGTYTDFIELADGRRSSIADMASELDVLLPQAIGTHLLPVCPSSGDSGFAPTDWCAVRHELGGWQDILQLAERRPLLLDGIYNHVGVDHPWVQGLLNGTDVRTSMLLHEYAASDLESAPSSPRGGSVLRTHHSRTGPRHLWHSFSEAAVDVRLENPIVRREVERHLNLLAQHKVWGVRLDAVAYYKKALGAPVRHAPGVHEMASEIAQMATERGLSIVAQLDIDDDGRRYFSSPHESQFAMNDFGFAVALAASIATGDAQHLAAHLRKLEGLERTVIRCPRNHDGLLLRSKLLSDDTRRALIEASTTCGLAVRMEASTPYELNASGPHLFGLLRPDVAVEDMIDVAIAITAAVTTHAYLYLPFLLGDRPELRVGRSQDGADPRLLNRLGIRQEDLHLAISSDQWTRRRHLLELLVEAHATDSSSANRAEVAMAEAGLLDLIATDRSIRLVVNLGSTTSPWPQDLAARRPEFHTSKSPMGLTPMALGLFKGPPGQGSTPGYARTT